MAMEYLRGKGLHAIAWLALALPAIAYAAENGAAARYAGEPYMGTVTARVRSPDGALKKTDTGTGSAHFERLSNGRTRLVVDGLINKQTASFVLDGSDNASGWRASEDGVTMNLAPGGNLRGSGTAGGTQRLDFDGAVTDAHFGLDMEMEVLRSKPGGPPPGTKILFRYDLNRDATASRGIGTRASAAGIAASPVRTTSGRSATQSNRRCKRTVWQTRNVASLSSAPMIMTRVPVCVQW
ncbi:MAG TPA: hypothetical protein VJ806_06115 [Luteimonas sp.]|nr:hypothetical protein [Luteimonas sp.]